MFRDDFVWGVASSAYQIEGTDPDDGRGKCVWDVFTEEGHIHENQNAYTACDHIHRYKEDYALMRELGIKAYRFSMNWARILPEGTGRVNQKAVELYRDMIITMKENGITPYITMFHWELPQALQLTGLQFCYKPKAAHVDAQHWHPVERGQLCKVEDCAVSAQGNQEVRTFQLLG